MAPSSMHDILFQRVFPVVVMVTGTFISFAPFRAILKALQDAQKTNQKTPHKRKVSNLIEDVVLVDAFLADLLRTQIHGTHTGRRGGIDTFEQHKSMTYSSIVVADGNKHPLTKNNLKTDDHNKNEENKDSAA